MAVLKERSNGARNGRAGVAKPSVILCADSAAMRRRIVYAMTEHDLQLSLIEVDDPQQLTELEDIDADSIVVFACDVDLPREMAALRRLRRELREPAAVPASPMAAGARGAAPSPAASRWYRASCAPASSGRPFPTVSGRCSPSSRAG